MMSTPTPPHPPNSSAASKKATGHVSTPLHFGISSPAPRSVPSPAASRKDQAGRTPINHPTTSSQGGKTIGGTPMVQSLSQTGNAPSSASPNANVISFGTPVGLGVDGITPGQLNITTPALGGIAMGVSLSDLGMTANGGQKRNEDEERKAKVRKVLKSIGRPKGRVSEEGISRISRRVGLTADFGYSEQQKQVGDRIVSLAGKKIVVDIDLKQQEAQSVQVMFDTENRALEQQAESVGKVLLNDLRPIDSLTLYAKLDRFAANLERLAHLDRLSCNGINCFEALSGIYSSLKRLYEQETKLSKEQEVMNKNSGRPAIHEHGRVGLNLDYWFDAASSRLNSETEVSAERLGESAFSIHIGVEPSMSGLHPPLRVSDIWLADPLELSSPDSGQGIPWQDPLPTFTSSGNGGDGAALDNQHKLPDLRFTAKLDPPVVVPWQVATAILQSCGLPGPQVFVMPPAWHTAVIDPASSILCNDPEAGSPVMSTRTVLNIDNDGDETETTHQYTLDLNKGVDPSYKLEELSFSHPRQIVEILPTLRQWVCLSSLLKDTFAATSPMKYEHRVSNNRSNGHITNLMATGAQTKPSISLADLLSAPITPPERMFINGLPVNISMVTSPIPTLSINFPDNTANTLGNVCVQILPNAELVVTHQEGLVDSHDSTHDAENKDLKKIAKALEACGNLGVWIEWLRSRLM